MSTPVSCLAHLVKSWVATAAVSYTVVQPVVTVRQQDGRDVNMVSMHMAPSSLTSMRLGMRRVYERVITRSLSFSVCVLQAALVYATPVLCVFKTWFIVHMSDAALVLHGQLSLCYSRFVTLLQPLYGAN